MPSVSAGTPPGARGSCTRRPQPRARHLALRRRRPRRQCRVGDLDDRERVRLGPDGQRLLSQQRADRFQLRAASKDGARSPTGSRAASGRAARCAPTIVYGPDGHVRLAVGAAGGATIIAQVAKAIIGVIDWHLSAQDAIALPTIYRAGRHGVRREGHRLEAMIPELQALGHARSQPLPPGLQGQCDRMGRRPLGRRRRSAQRRRGGLANRTGNLARQLEHFDNLVSMFLTRAGGEGRRRRSCGPSATAHGGRSAGPRRRGRSRRSRRR